jgi:hypothetical protein
MDFGDKVKLQVFASPAMNSVRNLALGIAEQRVNEQEKAKEKRPPQPSPRP